MRYMTKEWYEKCQNTGLHCCIGTTRQAETFSEEYFEKVYARNLRKHRRWEQDACEILGNPYNEAATDERTEELYELQLLQLKEILPAEILEKAADLRVLALGIASREVKTLLTDWCSQNDREIKAAQETYWKLEADAVTAGRLDKKLMADLAWLHDGRILEWKQDGADLVITVEYDERYILTFENCQVLQQDRNPAGGEWLYREIYPLADGGMEVHILIWQFVDQDNVELSYLTVKTDRITYERKAAMKYKAILFDLDGTLTESGIGITKSVQQALERMGRPEPDLEKLRVFVGPPLKAQFMAYAGFTEDEAEQAIKLYRERYTTVGIFENAVYDGIEAMLNALKQEGYVLAVASSKPEVFVKQILEHFHLNHYFTEMVGSELNGGRSRKSEVVEEALRRLNLSEDREHVIMVGDKEHDVLGAREAGMNCVAVTWGYGTEEELTASHPMLTISHPDELVKYLV